MELRTQKIHSFGRIAQIIALFYTLNSITVNASDRVDVALDVSTSSRVLSEVSDRSLVINGNAIPSWKGRFDLQYGLAYFTPSMVKNSCAPKRQNCSQIPGQSYPYEEYLQDPTSNSGQPVLKISYPKGSWSPGSEVPGGVLFYTYPNKLDPKTKADPISTVGAVLEYEVYFPSDFDFVKGGKLPGFMGGRSNGIGCGGGNKDPDCFSYRIMWRRNGYGEAYLYVPVDYQAPSFCSELPSCNATTPSLLCTECNPNAGTSFHRASFQFKKGQWNSLKLEMRLNTLNVTDGFLKLTANGQVAFEYSNIVWRIYDNVNIEGVNIASWFGGSNPTWAPQSDTYTYLKNFRIYYDGPAIPRSRSTVPEGPQVVINEVIDEAP